MKAFCVFVPFSFTLGSLFILAKDIGSGFSSAIETAVAAAADVDADAGVGGAGILEFSVFTVTAADVGGFCCCCCCCSDV